MSAAKTSKPKSDEPLVTFDDVRAGYDGTPVLRGLGGTIKRGDLLAVLGANGAGKSTLFKCITGEVKPFSGTVRLHDLPRRKIAYLPQRSDIDPSFPISVFDAVAMGLWREIGAFRGLSRAAEAEIWAALDTVGIAGQAERRLGVLSGGQFQRAMFAQLMLQNADLILLDEPFQAVDLETADTLISLIDKWHGEGRTVIAALHDAALVRDRFPQTLILARETIAWGPTAKVLTSANLVKSGEVTAAWQDSELGLSGEAMRARMSA
ncbi:High-affinity zinc uptake system ATP-binding protein ZnuC [Methyloligella halotolerans]|uniref:High-affinity zinc uptake system ATP-binding protein ZnuC n=1 Tax=Methyloligella halotolerans TaxID=1177755 RepID=A0A1E2RVH3_9HYPH|nr:ABC transporter ATP-binding protein [Methyloligella halotolerans]ODA66237.1 High-affinity zinc uptake system ATP-binding protein ZnuC [Methyloligella halotolerans]